MFCNRCKKEKNDGDSGKWCQSCLNKASAYNKAYRKKHVNVTGQVGEIRCSRCLVVKKEACFAGNSKKCLDCESYCDSYYEQNKDKEIARARKSLANKGRKAVSEYRKKHHRSHPEVIMLQSARHRAKKHGIKFDLSKKDIAIPKVCPVLGCKLEVGCGKPTPNSPSLDRINPELGYVKGNVCVISYRANTIKTNATATEIRKILKYIETNSPHK